MAEGLKEELRQLRPPGDDLLLTVHEVKELLHLGAQGMSDREVQALFDQVDEHRAGRIELEKFVDFLYSGGPLPPQVDVQLPGGEDGQAAAAPSDNEDHDLTWAEPIPLDRAILNEFMDLDQNGKVQAEYVWLDSGFSVDKRKFDLCSKSLTLDAPPQSVEDLPVWAYSGEERKDISLVPRRIYKDPFRRGHNIIVWADTYEEPTPGTGDRYGPPAKWNARPACENVMRLAEQQGEDPWFGIEQEYYLLDVRTKWPLGWPEGGYPGKHDCYYCATGSDKAVGREVVEAHYRACLYAGVAQGGINSEVVPGQWEYQIGPCSGIRAADDVWMSRHLLQRVCEVFNVDCTFDPKPVPDWPGTGCHTNYSTVATRAAGGIEVIKDHIERLRATHKDHLKVYGSGNERRLTGKDSTQGMDDFSYGIGDLGRDCAIRISAGVASKGFGYYEDRRPAANMDPYLVTGMLVETTILPPGACDASMLEMFGDPPAPTKEADAGFSPQDNSAASTMYQEMPSSVASD